MAERIFEGNFCKMPTVIERIAAAEADADVMKRNAQEAARTAVAQAEDEAAASLKIAREEAKAGLALSAAMAEKEAVSEAARFVTQSRLSADVMIARGEKHIPAAVEEIMQHI